MLFLKTRPRLNARVVGFRKLDLYYCRVSHRTPFDKHVCTHVYTCTFASREKNCIYWSRKLGNLPATPIHSLHGTSHVLSFTLPTQFHFYMFWVQSSQIFRTSFWSRPHAHKRRSCTDGPFAQAHLAHEPRRFPSKLAAHAQWMEQACKAVQRWKNRSWVERRRTQGTEGDLYQAKFCKNAGAPPSCHLECHHEEMAPYPGEQLGLPPALVLFGLVDRLPWPATPRHAPSCQRRDDGGVNGDLLASPEWKAVGDDFNPALFIRLCHNVEIAKKLILLHARFGPCTPRVSSQH